MCASFYTSTLNIKNVKYRRCCYNSILKGEEKKRNLNSNTSTFFDISCITQSLEIETSCFGVWLIIYKTPNHWWIGQKKKTLYDDRWFMVTLNCESRVHVERKPFFCSSQFNNCAMVFFIVWNLKKKVKRVNRQREKKGEKRKVCALFFHANTASRQCVTIARIPLFKFQPSALLVKWNDGEKTSLFDSFPTFQCRPPTYRESVMCVDGWLSSVTLLLALHHFRCWKVIAFL